MAKLKLKMVLPLALSLLALWLICGVCAVGSSGTKLIPTLPNPFLSTELVVDQRRRLGPVSPLVYGTNYGPWMNISPDLLLRLKTAGIAFLRFPGGNWGDENDLQPSQIDQFIRVARQLGAAPSISVRLRGGTPEAAASLVAYTNITRGYNVRYWSIGNEPSLYPEYDTAQFNAEWRLYASAMKAVDPRILLIGPEIHQYAGVKDVDPHDKAGRDWLREFLVANGDLVDIVSIHRYPFPNSSVNSAAKVDVLRSNSQEWNHIIPSLRAAIQETTGRALPIAITEVNSHWTDVTEGEATPDSHFNAIWWSDVLGRLITQKVDIVAYFALQTDTVNGGWGIVAGDHVRPVYYVYQLFDHFGREVVYAASEDKEVSIYASVRNDGALTIIVVNLGNEKKEKTMHLSSSIVPKQVEIWRLDAQHTAEKVDEITFSDFNTVTLPAHSVTLYVLQANPTARN